MWSENRTALATRTSSAWGNQRAQGGIVLHTSWRGRTIRVDPAAESTESTEIQEQVVTPILEVTEDPAIAETTESTKIQEQVVQPVVEVEDKPTPVVLRKGGNPYAVPREQTWSGLGVLTNFAENPACLDSRPWEIPDETMSVAEFIKAMDGGHHFSGNGVHKDRYFWIGAVARSFAKLPGAAEARPLIFKPEKDGIYQTVLWFDAEGNPVFVLGKDSNGTEVAFEIKEASVTELPPNAGFGRGVYIATSLEIGDIAVPIEIEGEFRLVVHPERDQKPLFYSPLVLTGEWGTPQAILERERPTVVNRHLPPALWPPALRDSGITPESPRADWPEKLWKKYCFSKN